LRIVLKGGAAIENLSESEVLMHRYNMAHQGAEEAVLPTALQLDVPVVAYTCTRWGSLLQGHEAWTGGIPAASDYRYSLDHPAIHLALTAPATLEELEQNLDILHNQSLDLTTKRRWEEYGTLIYGDGRDAFETKWLCKEQKAIAIQMSTSRERVR
jgi:aryl-alcohol dehydrogenase-like predicted oxidoreductase